MLPEKLIGKTPGAIGSSSASAMAATTMGCSVRSLVNSGEADESVVCSVVAVFVVGRAPGRYGSSVSTIGTPTVRADDGLTITTSTHVTHERSNLRRRHRAAGDRSAGAPVMRD
jgi:hypothetical protein